MQECVRWALDVQITAANVVQSLVSNIMVRSVTSTTVVIDPVFDGQTFRNHPPETRAWYRRHTYCGARNLEVQLSAYFLVRSRTRSTISLLMVQCQRWKCGGVLLSGGRLHGVQGLLAHATAHSTTVTSRSTKAALGTCFPVSVPEKKALNASSSPPMVLSLGLWPSGCAECHIRDSTWTPDNCTKCSIVTEECPYLI